MFMDGHFSYGIFLFERVSTNVLVMQRTDVVVLFSTNVSLHFGRQRIVSVSYVAHASRCSACLFVLCISLRLAARCSYAPFSYYVPWVYLQAFGVWKCPRHCFVTPIAGLARLTWARMTASKRSPQEFLAQRPR